MEPTSTPETSVPPTHGKLTGNTRRDFIRGIAGAGASTVGASVLAGAGANLFAEEAVAKGGATEFSNFKALAPSPADRLEVPEGFRADVLISYEDTFRGRGGKRYKFGYNNDFLAYFPLDGNREGLLFVNHEYPDPFFLHGYKPDGTAKEADQVQEEQDAVGNSIVHIKRGKDGVWQVVSPSKYNRRIYGDRPKLAFTGPLRGAPGIGASANGSLGNCSGGVTPWGTALSCEENFDGYGTNVAKDNPNGYGWHQYGGQPEDAEYEFKTFKKYGWVCEHDPYDPDWQPRKHTALGRFRHENTAFRAKPGHKFVLYMGDDKNNEGVYKFVSGRQFEPGRHSHNRKILEAGQLYIARWEPEGRRRFAKAGDTDPISPTEGKGTWVPVPKEALDDTATKLRAKFGTEEYDKHFATNRPEDLEVAEDGTVYIALTNNSTVLDSHGSVRRLREKAGDPEALEFTWRDYAGRRPDRVVQAGPGRVLQPGQPGVRQRRQPVGGHRHLLEPPEQGERVQVPRQQRGVLHPHLGAEQGRGLPLRQRPRAGGVDRSVLHARRQLPVRGRPAPRRGDGQLQLRARQVRPRVHLHQLVARRQPHGRRQPVHAAADHGRDHAAEQEGAGQPVRARGLGGG